MAAIVLAQIAIVLEETIVLPGIFVHRHTADARRPMVDTQTLAIVGHDKCGTQKYDGH